MGRRVLVGTVATLGLVALVGMFAALSLLFSSPGPAYAQTNSTPQFSSDAITLVVDEYTDVSEGTPWYRSIGTPVTATDADDDKLTYTLENVTTSYFTIHGKTGQLEVGPPLDYEDPNDRTHTVKVTATDPSGESDTITVNITVTNEEEPGRVSLYWDQPQVGTNLKATLTDPDGGITGKSWKWSSSDFKTGPYTEISTATLDTYTPVTNDVGKYLRATASYTDGHGTNKTAHAVSVRAVRVTPETNSAPAFDKDPDRLGGYGCTINGETGICRHISRSTPVGYYIYYASRATDPTDRDEIRYSLAGTKADSFRIDPSRGDLFTTEANVWGDSAFTITITATDPSGGTGGTDEITVQLTPNGGKLNPAIEGPSRITYPENGTWPLATYIATRLRHTSDGEGEGPIRTTGWLISVEPGGGDGDFFRMNDDGLLTFIQPPDYDDPADENGDNRYSFSITAYDGNPPPGERPGQSFYNVTVTVVNVEETLEIRGPSVVNHPENSREVSTYTLPEANGPVTWSVSGTDGEWFSISQTGELTFHRPPDYENPTDLDGGGDKGDQPDNAYLVAITVEDNTNIKTEHVRVRVTNVNESPTFDNDLETTITLEPDVGPNKQIGDPYTTTDPDENDLPTYTLSSPDTLPFQINEHDGQLSTISTLTQFDRTSYTVTILVTDGEDANGNLNDTPDDRITVTVNVGDGGGNTAPVFPAEAVTFSIAENTDTVEDVGDPVTADDDDTDDTLSYTLGGTDGGFFTIVSTSGQIQTKSEQTYDFETKPSYSVTVTANDGNGGTATKAVTITLTNVEEDGTVTLSTNQPTARAQVTATLDDPDGVTGTTAWQWSRSSDGSTGWANVGTNSASYTPADVDVNYYLRATASYTDGKGGGSKTAEAQTTQKVGTGTNRAPEFGDLTATREVAENTAANGNVGAVVGATDLDSGDTLTYSLTGADASSFTVDNNGQIKVGATTTLNYETNKKSYTVIVQVHDGKNASGGTDTAIDDTIVVTITVTDVEEAGTVTLSTNQPPARAELTATLTDLDGSISNTTWKWAKTSDPTNNSWQDITDATSDSYTPPDADLGSYLRATASYTDGEGSGKSAHAETTQAVGAGANRPPTFSGPSATREVAENPTAVTNVGAPVTATDPDTGNTPAYTLDTRGATLFDIDSVSGQIKTKSGVTYDHERTPSYSVTVTADDKNGGTATKAVTINVTDVDEDGTVSLSMTHPSARMPITATLTDPDSGVTGESWQWAKSSTAQGSYTDIPTATSATYTPPDGDVGSYLRATVSYEDDHGQNQTAEAVTANAVQAGANRAPTFAAGTVTRAVDENSAADVDVGGPVTATDLDAGNTLTYTLEGTDTDLFKVVSGGQIQTKPGVTYDFETKRSYSVTVKADDGNNGTATKDVTISLTNVEEAGTVRLSPTQPAARQAVTATLTDPDEVSDTPAWQWQRSSNRNTGWSDVGTDSSSYTPPDADLNYYLQATATYTDGQGSGKTATAKTVGVVQAGTNRPPTFTDGQTTSRDVAEDAAATDNVGTVVGATDQDNDSLTYSLTSTDASSFTVDNTGQIKVGDTTTLDYESAKNTYTVVVQVTDSKDPAGVTETNPTIDDNITVTINVTDVNEAPEFDSETATRSIAENSVADTNVGAIITATDPDADATLTYSLSGTDAGSFTIDSTGQIKVGASTTLDFESSKKTYTVNVEVRDSKDAAGAADTATDNTIEVTINVTDVNEKPTFTETDPTTRNVPENTSAGHDIGNAIAATDPDDGDTLIYSLDSTSATSFSIDTSNGQLKTKAALNKEATASYTVTVSVKDRQTDTNPDDTITVTITVTDANEPPEFPSTEDGTRSFPENTASGQNVGLAVVADDPDTGETLTYSLEETDKDSFTIVPGTGQIQTKSGVTYNHEDKETHSVTVKVVDSKGGTDTVAVTITVTDVNEKPTFNDQSPTTRSISENAVTGADIGAAVAATDEENDPLTYILGGTDVAHFSVVATSGQLQTKSALDKEIKDIYTVTVSVRDSKNEAGAADTDDDATITVNITVTDANDFPQFSTASVTRSVRENTSAVENLGRPVTATDGDNDTLIYSLDTAGATSFDIDGTSGQIKTKAGVTYDHETTPSYSVTVTADDNKGGTDTIEVTINVTDVYEPPLKPGTPTVSRTSNSVVSVTWTAPDNTGRPPILHYQYQYKKDTEPDWSGATFTTSGPTASVTIVTLDAGTSYDVEVRTINDEGPGPWSDTGTGSTNSPPDFSSATPAREVAENTVVVTSVGAPVTASDADSDDLAYTLEGPDANSFQIVSASGQIQTKADETYDHETDDSYTVTVKADDSNGGTDTIEVTITVTDVNEAPAFDEATTTHDVPENTVADTNIGDPVEAEDPDDGDSSTYSLGGTDASFFDIDTLTGQLKTKAALDHETNATYTVTVSVRDSKDANGDADTATDDTIDVTITVTDVNDPPEFPSTESGARSVTENTATNTNIGSPVRATDADHDNLTYTLEGTDAGSFAIDESSGQLKTKSALDHEDNDSYTVTVKASDGNDGVDTIEVTITVTDVNEAPSFDSPTAPRNVPENTAANQPVGEPVAAKDQDDEDSLAYSLGGTDSASFGINGSTGQITMGTGTTLDFETKASYEVTVTATDILKLSDTITVTINVTEGNDPPVFATDTATRRVAEKTQANTNLGSPFTATDAEGETLTYTLEGTDAASFDIVSTSGQLRTKAALDYEAKSSYSVTVKAADASANGTITVTITVTDVNEPPLAPGTPAVSGDSASSVSVTWTAPANQGRPAIAGYDYQYKKTNEPTWSGATYATTEVVTSATISGLDSSTSYDVQARAKNDEGTGPWSATGAGSTGNTDPAFSISATTRDVAENTPADVNIGYPVTATDDDNGDSLTYTLGGADATAFDIDAKTGQLKTKALLDHEDKDSYTVLVTATDSASASDNIMVVITVTDVNEPPSFGLGAGDRTVSEKTPPGGPVGLPVSAEDDDAGDTLTYSLAGADSASFGIDSGTGSITVGAGTRLNYEDGTKTTYEVTVTATDSSHLSATITVTIDVLNVEEDGVVTLTQLQPQVDTDLRASLDDPDGMVSVLTWKWEISSDNTNWGAIAGETLFSYTPVASDLNKFLRVTAFYSDGEGANKTAQAAAPNVVRDVPATNDAPEFPSTENGTRTVAENTGAGENVGAPVTATDADTDTLTYKLSGVDAPSFSIVDSSGQIQTKAPLDHESKDTYTVTVTATDPSDESDFVTVTITVTDVNEPPLAPGIPAITQNSETSLTMAWTAPSSTGRPAVTDYDYQYKKTAENTWTEVTNTSITGASVEITGLETTTYYHVQVRATNDEGTGDWSDSGIGVTRTLPNNPPAFPDSATTREVAETAEERANIGNPVDAQDTDNDPLTYILEGTDANSFMIDDESGQLKTKMPLDHEVKDSYSVLVKAVDGRGGSDAISVVINVIDVNEPPEFSGNLGVHSVPEDTAPGVNIGAPVAATGEEGDTLTYSLDSAGAQAFAIDASTGQLQTKAALDYETARVHSVTVYVRDGKNAQGATDTAVDDDISVTITVTDVNEPPAFTEAAPSRSVAENSTIGADVGTPVTATDPEVDTLTYSLDGTDKASFSIDTSSGQLKTRTALDFESGKRSYSVTVSVSDGKNADGNADTTADATVPVTIVVTDVNERPKVTIASTVRYAENGADPVDTYTVTDPENGTITWTLSGTDMDDFEISKVNGEGVLEFKTPPNYEAPADADDNNVYLVTVTVSDGTNTDDLAVSVTVFNVNEEPAFPAETGNRSIDENTAAGVSFGDAVAAVDPEGHTLTYKLAGTDGASFAIDTSTGQLKTRAPLDHETKFTYLVTVHVRDSLDQDDRVNAVTDDTINITITINNVEEPGWIVFSSRQPQIDTPFTATIEDPDGGVTSTIWKWESSPNKSTWTVISGQTSASYTPLTADGGKYLRVTASYTDGHGANKSAQADSDNPVREEPGDNVAPAFASPTATRAIDEGTAAGQNIGDPVSATDADPADGSLLTYSLTGPDAASFEIVRATGQLLTKAPLDHETKATYTVTVMVVDPSLMPAFISVTINVNDVDEPPVLSGLDVVDYPENGTDEVAQYTATDPENDSIIWSLEGDDKDLFDITGGELTFIASPDHDVAGDADGNNVYLVTVTASDGTTPVTLAVEVTVSNVNEAPEFPASETGDRTVAENTAADVNIGDPVAATDPDNGDTLTYTLGGADDGSFAIDETTGQLKTKDTLNYEAKDTYTVTVTATDQAGMSATKTVTVTVSSVNEVPEFTDGATASRSVDENRPADQDIGAAVGATDPDTGDTLTYTLEGDDAASFAIDETTGQLKTKDPLDYETKASYAVTVSVSDGKDIDGNADPSADNTIDVTISVTNVPEAGTVILSSLQPQVGTALTATLVDPDDATGVTWTWESSSDWSSGWAAISGATTDTYTPVAGDVGDYLRAKASYTNAGGTQVSAYGMSAYPVRAAPAPGTNVAPDFAATTATRSIAEDVPVGSAVGDPVTATDTDADDVLTYSLSGADAESFSIGMASGQLRTKVLLDHDTKASYTVVVTATDPSGLFDTITVTITVTDQNEPPVITGKTTVYYAEDRTDTVATYTAADPENGMITWSLAGDDSGDFLISSTGVLTFSTQPDLETPADEDTDNVYLITVQASDGPNTVPLDVTVTVTDAADPPPAPDAPTVEAAATDGHTALTVSWQEPATTGGSPITGYEVEYRKQGTEDWSSGENVTVTGVIAAITSVLPDTTYEVQVRAENADGWGAWSEPGTGRTEVTPLGQQVDLTVSYQAAGYTVNEGATRAVSVTLSAAADRALQIPITVAPVTAESGDYQVTGLTNGALSFVPGDSSKSFTFEALQDTDTSDETVTLGLGQLPDKVTAGSRPTAVVTIDDDDPVQSSRRRPSGGGGGGGGGGNFGSSAPGNKAPVFTDGTSASRLVAENTAAGINIGAPVTATDADRDTLTYTVGGDDGSAFSVDGATGQLKTKSALDFETKSSYRVTMGVFDPSGGSDTITVTITVTDVADVSLVSGSTQMMGVVDSEQDTTVSTLDGSVAVTFPSGSRSGDYQVRLDHDVTNCNANFSGEELWFCLTVDIFDNAGNLEQGVVLSQPATIKIRRNGDERGGVDAVLGLHAQGGVSVYTRGRTGGEWTESAFTLESDGVGGIVITITGVSSFGLYAGTTDSSVPVQVSHQAATVPVPTQNTGGRGASPEPTPTPAPTPQPGSSSEQSATPDPTPTPEPVVTLGTNPTPEPTLGHQVSAPFGPLGGQAATPPPAPTPEPTPVGIAKGFGNLASAPPPDGDSVPTAGPEVKVASFDSEGGKSGGMPSWYVAIIMMALAATVAGGSTYFVKRRRRVSSPVTVQRSREFNKWWSGW